ncbi:hypothetical protein [Blastococcus brunescens]|uniref:Uncharacterized protein n=1 Tax=Blastococcus brunescens TaxID=1564165 RepID=A0ABZ1B916_9ACTN|nr:hypothetical protein [Blastococcus sp. BMG 8361]WRL67299.1 hypothetical protein U6N30_22745 [Blastococcus sp. BMG 8361]
MTTPAEHRQRPLRVALLAVIAVGLVLLGGGLAVAIGIGRTADPSADSVAAGFSRDMARHHLQGSRWPTSCPSAAPIPRSSSSPSTSRRRS